MNECTGFEGLLEEVREELRGNSLVKLLDVNPTWRLEGNAYALCELARRGVSAKGVVKRLPLSRASLIELGNLFRPRDAFGAWKQVVTEVQYIYKTSLYAIWQYADDVEVAHARAALAVGLGDIADLGIEDIAKFINTNAEGAQSLLADNAERVMQSDQYMTLKKTCRYLNRRGIKNVPELDGVDEALAKGSTGVQREEFFELRDFIGAEIEQLYGVSLADLEYALENNSLVKAYDAYCLMFQRADNMSVRQIRQPFFGKLPERLGGYSDADSEDDALRRAEVRAATKRRTIASKHYLIPA